MQALISQDDIHTDESDDDYSDPSATNNEPRENQDDSAEEYNDESDVEYDSGSFDEDDDDEEDEKSDAEADGSRYNEIERQVRDMLEAYYHTFSNEKSLNESERTIDPTSDHERNGLLRGYNSFTAQSHSHSYQAEQRNLLYRLAAEGGIDSCLDWLVKRLVEEFPTLLIDKDSANQGPLWKAISISRVHFIKTVLGSKTDAAILSDAIGLCNENGNNCLHLAIENRLEPEIIQELIKRASVDSLSQQNARGFTPLHHAVESSGCTMSRIGIVDALIERDDTAFDCFQEKSNLSSVYQHHCVSWENHKHAQEVAKRKAIKRKENLRQLEKEKRSKKDKDKLDKDKPRKDKEKDKDKLRVMNADKSNKEPKHRPEPDKKDIRQLEIRNLESQRLDNKVPFQKPELLSRTSDLHKMTKVVSLLKLQPTITTTTTTMNSLPYQPNETRYRSVDSPADENSKMKTLETNLKTSINSEKSSGVIPAASTLGSTRDKNEIPNDAVAEELKRKLKLHYLRSIFQQQATIRTQKENKVLRSHQTAVRFLYGDNADDKEICFEFPAKISKDTAVINFERFEENYAKVNFDEVLQYVDFRRMKVEQLPILNRARGNAAKQNLSAGRTDLVHFFRWLKNKNVRNIIKVMVDDKSDVAHSDEAIEQSLEAFDIEILDWRKMDMDPETLYRACKSSKLRELHLWWSGSNAVLRAWSEPGGLCKMTTLQIIHIWGTHDNLNSPMRTEANLTEFDQRIKANRQATNLPSIERIYHKPYDRAQLRAGEFSQGQGGNMRNRIDTNQWLGTMDKFALGIANLKELAGLKRENLPLDLQKDVTVALIDDGVNLMHQALTKKIENGRSFAVSYDPAGLEGYREPYHASTTGHGTCMAYMISRVCPLVKMFICKLDVIRRAEGGKASFTAKSAAEAVNFAVDRGFDIISISWTVQRQIGENGNSEDIAKLQDALERAVRNETLVFCSAPDIGLTSGTLQNQHYPIGFPSISERIFKIGAARADGSTVGLTGDGGRLTYLLPGHNIKPRDDDIIYEEDDIPKTGSSVATALAVGLAALIIHCVRLGAIYNFQHNVRTSLNETSVREIKKFSFMKDALRKVNDAGSDRNKSDKNLEVEVFFKDASDVLNDDTKSDDDKWRKVALLANDLISSKMYSDSKNPMIQTGSI